MMRLSLAVLSAVIAVLFAMSIVGRAQSAVRFEYGRVTPYTVAQTQGGWVYQHVGYRACVAVTNEWTCREFEPKESSEAALRAMLATLGNEGWELVSVVDEDPNSSLALTYLFKRQRQ